MRWRGLFMIGALMGSWSAVAKELARDYHYCLAYQQAAYQPEDPVAERCLWTIGTHRRHRRFAMAVSGHLVDWMEELAQDRADAERHYPQFSRNYPNDMVYRDGPDLAFVSSWMEGRRRPILIPEARQMLAQVIYEERRRGLPPRVGESIRWSKAFNRRHPQIKLSRLLVTLSFGETSRLMRTGHEEELIAWILAQPDLSISVGEMFRAGYRAADGDVYLALLTIENVLSRHFLDPRREQLEFVQRLRPITNTWGHRGDKFGAWYHLYGLMLHGYAKGLSGALVASTAETFGSHVSNPPGERERQEDYINHAGAMLGGFLRRYVRRGGVEAHVPDEEALDPARYMALDEFPVFHSWEADGVAWRSQSITEGE